MLLLFIGLARAMPHFPYWPYNRPAHLGGATALGRLVWPFVHVVVLTNLFYLGPHARIATYVQVYFVVRSLEGLWHMSCEHVPASECPDRMGMPNPTVHVALAGLAVDACGHLMKDLNS